MTLIEERGVHALSLREAARQAGVSSGAPYRHFKDKDELLLAIAEEGDALLGKCTEEELAVLGDADPALEFRHRGIAFVLFAAEHPVHFQMMYSRDVRALRKSAEQTCEEDALETLIGRDPRLEDHAAQVSIAGQCLAYGLARMIVDGELVVPPSPGGLRAFVESILDVMTTGLRPPADPAR